MKPFYVTTPIYYVNDRPHIGHAYSTVAADVLARFARLQGRPTRFLTGTDEHGQKIEEKAAELKKEPQAFVDEMSPPFKAAFEQLDCSFDDYIRTTEPRHEERVKAAWSAMQERGDIYLGKYEGWYSVADEAFITEHELSLLDEVTRSKVQRVAEPSYFFKLSDYTERLLEFYEANPTFVQPEGRFNEVKAFVKQGLRDLSISRTSFSWGIDVPGDDAHVMYVWLDALTNYASALGGPIPAGAAPLFEKFWGKDSDVVHIVGKDILRFHAIYWPAFLMSMGAELPKQIWAHGWLTINGQKMSKRSGNFIPPEPLVEQLGADVVRYYLMREVGFGQDGDFAHANVLARYNGELANGLGNLLNRMVKSIVARSFEGKVPPVAELQDVDRELIEVAERVAKTSAAHFEAIAPHRALDSIWELVGAANRYVDSTAPWQLAKDGDLERLGTVSYLVLESLRWLSILIAPVMPNKSAGLRAQLGLEPLSPEEGTSQWPKAWGDAHALQVGTQTEVAEALFPRIDKNREAEIYGALGVDPNAKKNSEKNAPKKAKKKKSSKKAPETPSEIGFDDFMKVDLRLGLILEASPLEKSDRLHKLKIDLGEESPRQVLAGIREHYDAQDLVGKRVVVVANLAPRKIMGVESQGMVLAASDPSGLSVVTVEKDIAPGTRIS